MLNEKRLIGVHPDLVRVVRRAATLAEFQVIEGVRTIERQRELFAQGRTKPGRIVTRTMASRHLTGHAVDLAYIESDGSIDWHATKNFIGIGYAMLAAGKDLDVPIRWGYDWDRDGKLQERGEYDGPHFELPVSEYP